VMPANKTVLVYRNELLPISETFIKEQILALKDWRAVLVGRRLLHQLTLDDLDVRVVDPQRTIADRLFWKLGKLVGTMPPAAARALRSEGARLVHAHFATDALDAWTIARALRLPLLVTLHGYDINTHREWWEAGNGGTRMQLYPRRLLRLAAQPQVRFLAVSEALRQRAIEFGIPANKIDVSYIGIDTSRFAPGGLPIAQRPSRVLFVGRLVEKKGCRYLIDAMAKVQREIPTAELVVVGDGPLRQELDTLASTSGVRATFRGALSSTEVKRELDGSRIFCLPSITASNGDAEGFGLVLLEAQASGVPVVTSALGGATEGIREGFTGFSFAEKDVEALARILTGLLKDDKIVVQMGERGPSYVATEFDLIRCTTRLERLYDAIYCGPAR
jgi:glycosyltransferase involved in cell wall biosynthesis